MPDADGTDDRLLTICQTTFKGSRVDIKCVG